MYEIIETPWDERAFGFKTYEIKKISEELFSSLQDINGHFTVKINPTESKEILHKYGFYYCDTLIEPFCYKESFRPVYNSLISINECTDLSGILEMCYDTFSYDRFHRDFIIQDTKADQRYVNWLEDIYCEGLVYLLVYNGETAGFFATKNDKILLHALSQKYRGKGLAKYFWSAACGALYDSGYTSLESSISAANLAILNVYSTLGFSFRNPVDIYHRSSSLIL